MIFMVILNLFLLFIFIFTFYNIELNDSASIYAANRQSSCNIYNSNSYCSVYITFDKNTVVKEYRVELDMMLTPEAFESNVTKILNWLEPLDVKFKTKFPSIKMFTIEIKKEPARVIELLYKDPHVDDVGENPSIIYIDNQEIQPVTVPEKRLNNIEEVLR